MAVFLGGCGAEALLSCGSAVAWLSSIEPVRLSDVGSVFVAEKRGLVVEEQRGRVSVQQLLELPPSL